MFFSIPLNIILFIIETNGPSPFLFDCKLEMLLVEKCKNIDS